MLDDDGEALEGHAETTPSLQPVMAMDAAPAVLRKDPAGEAGRDDTAAQRGVSLKIPIPSGAEAD